MLFSKPFSLNSSSLGWRDLEGDVITILNVQLDN